MSKTKTILKVAIAGYVCDINEVQLAGGGPYDLERVTLERRRQIDGSSLWAVVKNGHWNLNKDQEWELEPMPSSRDPAFSARCRYDDPVIAVMTWTFACIGLKGMLKEED